MDKLEIFSFYFTLYSITKQRRSSTFRDAGEFCFHASHKIKTRFSEGSISIYPRMPELLIFWFHSLLDRKHQSTTLVFGSRVERTSLESNLFSLGVLEESLMYGSFDISNDSHVLFCHN